MEQNKSDYIKFEVLKSFESFKIMQRFVNQITDENLKLKLENALANKEPFQNFKLLIDRSDFRLSWFDYKQNELENRVKKQFELENKTDHK